MAVAHALNDWLPRMIQALKPFYSPEIDKGAKWSNEIDAALEGTIFGIVCLTSDNLNNPWLHFEAGALSKTSGALVWTFLVGLTPGDVPPPLGKFQHTVANKGDTLQLLKTINSRLPEAGGQPLQESLLEENFEIFWPQLEKHLGKATQMKDGTTTALHSRAGSVRDDRAVLDEILELARNQERRLSALESRFSLPLPPVRSTKTATAWQVINLTISSNEPKDVDEIATKLDQLFGAKIIATPTADDKTEMHVRFPSFRTEPEIDRIIERVTEGLDLDLITVEYLSPK